MIIVHTDTGLYLIQSYAQPPHPCAVREGMLCTMYMWSECTCIIIFGICSVCMCDELHVIVHVHVYVQHTCIMYRYTCTIPFILQNWTKVNKSGGGPWPEERSTHAAVCLNYGQQYPQLLVTGGRGRQGKRLADVWILDIERGSWRKVRLEYTQLCKTCPNIFSGYTDRVMK